MGNNDDNIKRNVERSISNSTRTWQTYYPVRDNEGSTLKMIWEGATLMTQHEKDGDIVVSDDNRIKQWRDRDWQHHWLKVNKIGIIVDDK